MNDEPAAFDLGDMTDDERTAFVMSMQVNPAWTVTFAPGVLNNRFVPRDNGRKILQHKMRASLNRKDGGASHMCEVWVDVPMVDDV